jgi:uncharacterized protein
MSERDGYEHGVPCWIDTWRSDAESAVGFYSRLFEWDPEDTMPPDVSGEHFMCRLRGHDVAAIASRPNAAPPVSAWNTYVWVDDATEAAARASEAGGRVVMEPFESLDGGRIAVIADPAGAAIGVWQPGAHRGAQLVNEPGAWSMSALNTRDTEGAKRFYGTVFGWRPDVMQAGDAEFTLFRLPSYVGGEPEQPVPRDVIATMAPMGDQLPDSVPAHWSVDFWVGDLDASVEKADRLGGKVVAPPYEIPNTPLRQAVLADPQGATFSVTKVNVEG